MFFLLAAASLTLMQAPVDACGLLTPAAIRQAIGAEAEAGKAGTSFFAGNTNCEFKLGPRAVVSIVATTGPNQPSYFGPRNPGDQRFKNATPIDGVGDKGFVWPASANEASVAFLKGATQIDLRISNLGRVLTPAQLIALAKAALAAMP